MIPELRILVVDEHALNRQVLGLALSQHGHGRGWQVVLAGSAEEAIGLVGEERIDVLVSDLQLDGSSGAELFKRIRLLNPYVHGILLSARPTGQDLIASAREDIHVLSKPCPLPQIISLVHRCIGQSPPMPHQDTSYSNRSLFQSLRATYGLQISPAHDAIEYSYVPLDPERLGLVALNGKERGVAHQLKRRELKDRAERLLRSDASPSRALDLLQQEMGDQIKSSATHIFIGMFDKLKQTFSHAQIGFDSPELYRKRQIKEIAADMVTLKGDDQLCLNDAAEDEDTLTEILRITVEWGAKQGSQLTFDF